MDPGFDFFALVVDVPTASPTEVNLRKMQFSPLGSIPSGNPANIVDLMHLWMSDAMPTQSLCADPRARARSRHQPTSTRSVAGFVINEVQPPDLRTSLESSSNPPVGSYATRALQDAYERSAQTMLSARQLRAALQ